MRGVVITGIGLVTSLGLDRESTWTALKQGQSAARWLDQPHDDPDLEPGHAGFPIPWPTPLAPDVDPAYALLEMASDEAMLDAALSHDSTFDRDRAATFIGLSKGGIRSLANAHRLIRAGSTDEPAIARAWMRAWPGAGASMVANRHGLRGPCLAPVAACATGLIAVLEAARSIESGECDLALAGSADASLDPLVLAAFRRMKVLADPGDDPRRAVRPWNRNRSGFLVGEGGAILVLEAADHARHRSQAPYARLLGGAFGSIAHDLTALDPDPSGLAYLIGKALKNAGLKPADLDALNVHGTATRSNDPYECQAIRQALGSDADRLPCSANKGQIGHLLGAAGSVELAILALSIRDGFAPPTLNLDDPDPLCDLDGTPLVGRSLPIRAALKLSIGFGGHIAAAVLGREPGGRRGHGTGLVPTRRIGEDGLLEVDEVDPAFPF